MRITSAALVLIDSVRLSKSRCHIRRMRLSTLGPLFGLLGQLVSEPSEHTQYIYGYACG